MTVLLGTLLTCRTLFEGACTKTRNNETKRPKRNHRNDRNETTETSVTTETGKIISK